MTTQHKQNQSEEKGPAPDARHEQSFRRTEQSRQPLRWAWWSSTTTRKCCLTFCAMRTTTAPSPSPLMNTNRGVVSPVVARMYYRQTIVKQETMPVADREARLRELAKALGKARGMTDKAMQDDVGDDLFSAWWEGTNEPRASVVRNDDGSIALVGIADEMFKEAVAGLAALETAALRAASEAHEERTRHRGPRRGTVPPDCIDTLAAVYRGSTGAKPGAGHGPFVRFVCAFLAAIRANISEDYVVELAQNARSRARTNCSKWAPSPFDPFGLAAGGDVSPLLRLTNSPFASFRGCGCPLGDNRRDDIYVE